MDDLCGSILEIGLPWLGPTSTPPPADHWRPGWVPHAHLILHQQPLTTRAYTALYWRTCSLRSCARAPPGLDHRIMLDVEFVLGPSLLSLFRTPQEQRPSRGEAHCSPCLDAVSVWQLHSPEAF